MIEGLREKLMEHTPGEERNLQGEPYNYKKRLDEQDRILFQKLELDPNGDEENAITETFLMKKNSRFAAVPEHVHSYIEFNYMYSGTCQEVIDGKKHILEPGQMVMIDTNTPHSIGFTGENDILINFIVDKSFFSTTVLSRLDAEQVSSQFILNALNPDNCEMNYLIFNTSASARFGRMLDELIYECLFPQAHSQDIRELLFTVLLLELATAKNIEIDTKSISKSSSVLMMALKYMEENYLDATLDSTAFYAGVSPHYLSSLIKKNTCQNFKEIIIGHKMKEAVSQLLTTERRIDEIALSVGYSNLTHFYRIFKEMYGCSPRQYRQKHGTGTKKI